MKRKGIYTLLAIIAMMQITGCQKDIPKPETKPRLNQLQGIGGMKTMSVLASKPMTNNEPSLSVQYQTKGQNVFVECVMTGISFLESDLSKQKVGKILIWVDGQRQQEATAAVFIIKQLSAGSHHLRLEVVDLKNKPYGVSKEFTVTIPTI